MTYASLPNSGQSLGQTRDAIRNNFDLIKTTVDQNHIDFDAGGAGKHFAIQMPVTGGTPTGGFVAGDANLYGRNLSAASQLVFRPDATTDEYQLTRAITASYAKFKTNTALPSANGSGGWTFLPGGMLLQYGSFTAASSGAVTVSFPIAFTGVPFSVQLTPVVDNNSTIRLSILSGSVTNTQFVTEQTNSSHLITVYFVAIGI